jgi:hypothetical protein
MLNKSKLIQHIKLSRVTLAVLKTSVLQSGRMLTDQGGRSYWPFPNVTVAADFVS